MSAVASSYKNTSHSLPGWLILAAAAVAGLIITASALGLPQWVRFAFRLVSTLIHLGLGAY